MKRIFQVLMSFLAFNLMVGALSTTLQESAGVPITLTAIVSIVLVVIYAFKKKEETPNVYMNGIQVEIWVKWIAKNLFKDNFFMTLAFKADQHVLAGKVVHIPQSGASAAVVKNRSSLPATVTQRTDTTATYEINEFTTDPRLIPNADTVELSYDKMAEVMADDRNALSETVADNLLIEWAPTVATQIIRTSGDAEAAHVNSTATLNRMKLIAADLLKAMTLMNKQNIPGSNRYALIDAVMYQQLIDELTETQYRDFSRAYDEKTGVLGMLHSFKIIMRSNVLTYDNAATPQPKAYGAAEATTDNGAVLCWHPDYVERALGEIKVFNNDNDPTYYGDLFSFLLRMGGRKRRSDGKGVIVIVQAAEGA